MLSAKTEKKLTVVFFCLTCQFNLLNLGASKERVFFCDPKKFTSSIKTPGGSIFCRATTAISFQIDPVYQNSQQKNSCHRTITLLLRGRWRCQIVTFEGRKQIAQGEELVSTPVGCLWSDHAPGPSPRRLQWISTTATGNSEKTGLTGHSSWRAMMRLKAQRHPKGTPNTYCALEWRSMASQHQGLFAHLTIALQASH